MLLLAKVFFTVLLPIYEFFFPIAPVRHFDVTRSKFSCLIISFNSLFKSIRLFELLLRLALFLKTILLWI